MSAESVFPREPRSRLGAIVWRWAQTRGLLERTLRSLRLDVADCLFYLSLVIALFLLQVEPVLWRKPIPKEDLVASLLGGPDLLLQPFKSGVQSGALWMVFLVALGNAWLLDQGLRRFGGQDASFRPWVLRLRPLLAAPPFLGLWTLPGWRALMESRPRWAMRRPAAELRLDGTTRKAVLPEGRQPLRSFLDRLGFSPWFFALWMIPVNLLALRAGLAWLGTPERRTGGLLLLLGLGRFALRGLGFLALGIYLLRRIKGQPFSWRKKLFLGTLTLTWLMPQVSPFLVTLFLCIQVERQRFETAVYSAWSESGSRPEDLSSQVRPDAGPLPLPVRWILGPLEKNEASSRLLAQKLGFYRMKTFLLMFDTGALLSLLVRLPNRPWAQWPGAAVLVLFVGAETLLAACGLLARSGAFAMSFFQADSWRRDQERHPWVRYALLCAVASIAGGFQIGLAAAQKETAKLASSLAQGCAVVGVFQVLFLLPGLFRKLTGKSEEYGIGALTWLLVFQGMTVLGQEMAKSPEQAKGITSLAHGIVLLIPLWALLLWAFRGRALLRPFGLGDLFDTRLPRRVRWSLGWIALTSALPLGGLFIPLWIRTLRRLESERGGTLAKPEVGAVEPVAVVASA